MTEDEFEAVAQQVVIDAELHVTAASIASCLPQWFRDLCAAHTAETQRLTNAGHLAAAAVYAAHGPMLDDFGEGYGAACLDPHTDADGFEDPQVYPCATLRALAEILEDAR